MCVLDSLQMNCVEKKRLGQFGVQVLEDFETLSQLCCSYVIAFQIPESAARLINPIPVNDELTSHFTTEV